MPRVITKNSGLVAAAAAALNQTRILIDDDPSLSVADMNAKCRRVEDLGLVVEALAMYSQKLVTPEFYEKQLQGRDARDNESEEMLDLIFATRSFDMGPIFNWGGIHSCYTQMDTDFASRFDKILDAAELAMQDTVDSLDEYIEVLN